MYREKIQAAKLLVPQRLDIAGRIPLAMEILETGLIDYESPAFILYRDTLLAESPSGLFHEEGALLDFDQRVRRFAALVQSVQQNGFSDSSSIPINSGVPVNGAHRIAIGVCLDLSLPTHETDETLSRYLDYQYFQARSSRSDLVIRLGSVVAKVLRDSRAVVSFDSNKDIRVEIGTLEGSGKVRCHAQVCVEFDEYEVLNLFTASYSMEKWWRPALAAKMAAERELNGGGMVTFYLLSFEPTLDPVEFKQRLRNEHYGSGSRSGAMIHIPDSNFDSSRLFDFLALSDSRTKVEGMAAVFSSLQASIWKLQNRLEFSVLKLLFLLPPSWRRAALAFITGFLNRLRKIRKVH